MRGEDAAVERDIITKKITSTTIISTKKNITRTTTMSSSPLRTITRKAEDVARITRRSTTTNSETGITNSIKENAEEEEGNESRGMSVKIGRNVRNGSHTTKIITLTLVFLTNWCVTSTSTRAR